MTCEGSPESARHTKSALAQMPAVNFGFIAAKRNRLWGLWKKERSGRVRHPSLSTPPLVGHINLVSTETRVHVLSMSSDPQATFDQHVLDMIDASPVGGVPRTPAHQDALRHLVEAHQVYHSADHPDGYVTVRALSARPSFHAGNIAAVVAGREAPSALEADTAVFDRYVASLPAELQPTVEPFRTKAVSRRLLHRAKLDEAVHDPVHSLFLVPGVGLSPGLPGNYLYGSIIEDDASDPNCTWSIHVHDRDDGVAMCDGLPRAAAWAKFEELLASAPFMLSELDALDFRLNFEPTTPA